MVVVALALIVVIGCAAACARRLYFATFATTWDLEEVLRLLRRTPKEARRARFCEVAGRLPETAWERALAVALTEERKELRAALVNEELTEIDWELARWDRVPRVCASLSVSLALLLATTVLRRGLSDPEALSGEIGELVTHGVVGQALDVACLGLLGAAICMAFRQRADKAAKARSAAVDRLLAVLEGEPDPEFDGENP